MNQRTPHSMTSLAPADDLSLSTMVSCRNRRRLAIASMAIGLGIASGWSAFINAEQPEPLNRLGRFTGRGYSDGYHACQTTGLRLRADLPPTSYSHRGGSPQHHATNGYHATNGPGQLVAGFATFYDKFDHDCGSNQACSSQAYGSVGMQSHSFVQPLATDGQVYFPESLSIIAPAPLASFPQAPERSEPLSSMTPNAIRLPNPTNPLLTLDPAAEAQRELEERERELNEQRRMLAEQERYRQFQVFEKLRLLEQAEQLRLDGHHDDESLSVKPEIDETEIGETEIGRFSRPNTRDTFPAERSRVDEAELPSPASTDLLDQGSSIRSRPRLSPDALMGPTLAVESSPLAQSFLHHPKSSSNALSSGDHTTASDMPQFSTSDSRNNSLQDSNSSSTMLGPIESHESEPTALLLTPRTGGTIAKPETTEAELNYRTSNATAQNATGQHATSPIVQPADDASFDSAQKPERRIASGDWLIIRQPR